jgi:hypothetical protein
MVLCSWQQADRWRLRPTSIGASCSLRCLGLTLGTGTVAWCAQPSEGRQGVVVRVARVIALCTRGWAPDPTIPYRLALSARTLADTLTYGRPVGRERGPTG